MRTLWTWERADPNAAAPPIGRPRHPHTAMRDALNAVRHVMYAQGKSIGEPSLLVALRGAVPLVLARRALKAWKAIDRVRRARAVAAQRTSIVPIGPGVFGSLDTAQVGRVEGEPAKAMQLVDVCSTATNALSVGSTPSGNDVVALLEATRVSPHGLPLGVFLDRGSENNNVQVRSYAEQHHVVLIFNVPRTPQHNPWVERKWRDVRDVAELRASTPLASLEEARRRVGRAIDVLDRGRLRAKHGLRTSADRDQDGRPCYAPSSRVNLWRDVRSAQTAARERCVRARDRPRAEREAAIEVFASRGLTEWTRGGVRVVNAVSEIIS